MSNSNRIYKTICQNCGIEFNAKNYGKKYCDNCDIKINYSKCPICGKLNRKRVCCPECLSTYRSINNPAKRPEVRKKISKKASKGIEVAKKRNLEKYGVEFPFQSKEIQAKARETQRKNNNGKLAWNTEKQIQTMIKKYGAPYSSQVLEIKEKQIKHWNKTMLEKYGVKSPMLVNEFRKKSFKNSNQSSLERKTEEFLKNKNINYETQYIVSNEKFKHTFNFAIFDKDKNLSILVECDGEYFHAYTGDANDYKVKDEEDTYFIIDLIPKNVKFIKIIESKFEEGIKELSYAIGLNYNDYINDIFNWCRDINFPFPNYTDKQLHASYNQLLKYKPENNIKIKAGNKIIKHFHKSIYKCKTNNKPSAYDAWNNDELLLKCIKNRIIYKDYVDPNRILAGFSINKIAPVPKMFSPFLAKYLINKYLNKYDLIFDPFSGYSGRMLGAIANNKNYVGQDINEITINESKQIINYFNLQDKVKLKVQDITKDTIKEYDCLFTCPPYNLKETWNNKNQLNLNCDTWIDICLSTYKCKTYLFVVDKTEKYKDYIVENIENKSHFGSNIEKIILINK